MSGSDGDAKLAPPTWVNKDLVQQILRAGDDDPTLVVSSWDIVMANAVGEGYASDMFRVVVNLHNAGERRLIFKCQPQGGLREEANRAMKAFETESLMLCKTLPKLQKLLDRARPEEFKPIYAKCLYHGKDPIQYLVLEDLRHLGYINAERQKGLDLNHCILVCKTLARLHASSLALFHEDPASMEPYKDSIYVEQNREHIAPFFKNNLRTLTAEVSKWPGYEQYASKIGNFVDSGYDRVLQTYEKKIDRLNVLLHGDPWSNNIMFRYSDDALEDIRFIDFQLSNFSSPVIDLQYFIHTSPNPQVRLSCLDTLLEQYHRTFNEILDILGCSRYSIPLEELQKSFNENYDYGFIAAATILPLVLADSAEALDMEEALSTGEGTTGNNVRMYANERYVTAMKQLLPLFGQKGVFD